MRIPPFPTSHPPLSMTQPTLSHHSKHPTRPLPPRNNPSPRALPRRKMGYTGSSIHRLFSNSPSQAPPTGNFPSQTKPGERPHRLAPPFHPFSAHHRVAELGCAWEQLTPRLDPPSLFLALCPLGPHARKIAERLVYARQTRARHPCAQAVEREIRG